MRDKTTAATEDVRCPAFAPGTTFWLSVAVVVLVSAAVYFNALYNGFAYDDTYQIIQNQWVKDIKYLPQVFSEGVWGFMGINKGGNYYRPLMYVTYMADYAVFGLKPWGFHLTNILFHLGVSILVLLITGRLLRESGLFRQSSDGGVKWWAYSPLTAALLFAAHPIHTEAVTWIAGLPEPAFAFFGLLSFLFYMKWEAGQKKTAVLSLVCFWLALLYKETAMTLPLFLIVYDYSFRGKRLTYDNLKRYVPYLIVAGVYLVVRFHALGGFAPGRRRIELPAWQYFINIFPLFVQYVEKLFLPFNLHGYYLFHPITSITGPKGIISCSIVIIFAALLIIAVKKSKPVFFGLAVFIIALLPVFYVRGLGANTFTERYLYLPSFGFAFLAAVLIEWTKKRAPKVAVVLISLFLAVIGLYGAGTITRNPVWKNTYAFYDDIIKKEPSFVTLAMENTMLDAMEYLERGQLDYAVTALKYAIGLNPYYADARDKLGIAYERLGLSDAAIEQFKIAAGLAPASADIRTNFGNALFTRGRIHEAIEQYQSALELNSSLVEARYNLALAYEQNGSIDEAIEQLKKAVQMDPANQTFRNELDRAYALKKDK